MGLRRRYGRRDPARRAERGAAAVEFALVSTMFLTLVFGILQYGLYFNDSLKARQAVRQTARMAIVHGTNPDCGDGWAGISCTADEMYGNESDDAKTYVSVSAPNGWARGNVLRVCLIAQSHGGFGMLPMPNDGFVHASIEMSIEKEDEPSGMPPSDAAPAGQDWSWCD